MDFEGKYNVKSPGKQADNYTTYCNKVLLKLFLLKCTLYFGISNDRLHNLTQFLHVILLQNKYSAQRGLLGCFYVI